MEYLIPLLIILFILLVIVTLVGHGIWVALAWFFRELRGGRTGGLPPSASQTPAAERPCFNCGYSLQIQMKFCGVCGAHRLTLTQEEHLRELEGTLRQLERLHQSGALDAVNFRVLKTKIETEREQMLFPDGRPGAARQPSLFAPESRSRKTPPVTAKPVDSERPPFIVPETSEELPPEKETPTPGAWAKDSDDAKPVEPFLRPPRRPFAEVLAAFMEQSNVRWGEIIGGVLIIGCSTALVISLWAQISRVPLMKFLIFTTVTAALFGVGFYTEHHWKLPTTSRGILTIATLLVPLNFLAIAAVSAGMAPTGALVIGSEIIAPAIFLFLVYFAGRVITPSWPHLLAAGALGSSAGQLLIRHLAAPDNSANLLILLGAFPVLCYVVASGWVLKLALADGEIDEGEANAIFVTLGTLTFAAVLPFGLLLYKTGSIGMAMMHLAPLVTLGGTPMLATGIVLWQRVQRKELVATRTAGASIAILGTAMAVAGMVLAWPNPASIVPAALFNFAVFTAVAVFLDEPRAHVIAAGCLTLAYVIAVHVLAGHVAWENLRVASLLRITESVSTGQALTIPFVSFVLVYEALRRRRGGRHAFSYLLAACAAAVVSLLFLFAFAIGPATDPYHISAILALYAAGALWFAWREKFVAFTWTGTVLLFFTAAQVCHSLLAVRFPWQASFLCFAAACTAGALALRQLGKADVERLLVAPLQKSATAGSIAAALFLLAGIAWRGFEPASLFATHTLILAAVLVGLLILSHVAIFCTGFQMALTLGAILLTKSYLQCFEWYAYRPNAWLHPGGLQVQGSVLGLICLMWIVIRALARRRGAARTDQIENERGWAARLVIEMPFAFDHLLAGALVIGFVMLIAFGTASGISAELTNAARTQLVFNLAGFPHALIFGIGSLILLAILLTVMFANLRERGHAVFALGMLFVLWSFCPLLAGRFESQFATASAGRWGVAIFLLAVSITYAFGRKLSPTSLRGGFVITRAVLLFLTLTPLILLTFSPIVDDINYVPARGPQAGFFRAMGSVALYGVPLILAVSALGIHAFRERSAPFAFAAGLLVNFTVTSVHIASVAQLNGSMNRVVLVNSLQLNAIAAAGVALVWMAMRGTWMTLPLPLGAGAFRGSERFLLGCQKLIAVSFVALFIVPIALHLIALPNRAGAATFVAGSFNGWLAVVLTVSVAMVFDKLFWKPLSVATLAASLLATGALGAFGIARFGVAKWAGLHVLLGAVLLIAWVLLLARDLPKFCHVEERKLIARMWARIGLTLADDWEWDSVLSATAVGASAVLLALRGPFSDPLGAWWSIGGLLSMCALAAALNWVTFKRAYLYAAGILFNLSVSIWLLKYQNQQLTSLSAFVEANVIALSLTGVLWLWLELRTRRVEPGTHSDTAASFHNVAALASLLAMGGVVAVRLRADLLDFYPTLLPVLDLFALASVVGLMAACLWDREAKYAVAGLYLLGLLTAATVLHHLSLTPRHLAWALTIAGAIYALAAALIWRARERVVSWASRLKIPPRIDPAISELVWLSVFNSLIVATVVGLAFWIDLSFFEWPLRAVAAMAVVTQALTFGLMAQGQHRLKWQRAAVAMFLLGAVFLGWSGLAPGASGTWLNRAVILMTLMFATVASFGIGLDKLIAREPDWSRAFRDCVPAMTIAGIVALGFVLSTEVYYQIEFGAVRVRFLALVTVGVTLAAVVVICIVFAVSPKHDPLSLSERWRSGYVYVAEVMLVLLFMHIRLTMPWLFHGFFQRYWPLVVLTIAYAGVAISEVLRRRQIRVLAQPIERTGAFLPLLPVIGFWIAQSQVEYSTLLFVVGGLYGVLSILRSSFWFGLAAALAGNGGLWYLLHETSEYHFLQHPQLWLIPAAISVLIAAHLNRKDFSEAQMTGIRYLCLITIYVSSTADIFVNGVASSPWLPLVLAGLSVAGVFAGMIFRIRAFLLLGSIFLLLAIATMIKYASVNFGWTWLWYVAGIITGALIIATFAVFEKKRAEVLRLVDELKDWQR
ncbi:MAG TPA: hypothetical protein VLQ90_04720 [Pyrinomonadaceae bacterium]|nr:hypothetical protein [Pyrinomonadaceae bacterium]